MALTLVMTALPWRSVWTGAASTTTARRPTCVQGGVLGEAFVPVSRCLGRRFVLRCAGGVLCANVSAWDWSCGADAGVAVQLGESADVLCPSTALEHCVG